MAQSIGAKYRSKLKRYVKREVKERRQWLWEQAKEGIAAGAQAAAGAAASVIGAATTGNYEELLPGPSPAERHRELMASSRQQHSVRLRKTPKVNR
jgi:hypothetical protein